jgi:hypothetical protein
MASEPLTIGVLMDESRQLPSWEFDMIAELLSADFIAGVVLIYVKPFDLPKRSDQKSSVAFRLFERFERAWFKKLPDASIRMPIDDLPDKFGRLRARSMIMGSESRSQETDLLYVPNQLMNYAVTEIPKYGSWRVQFGNVQNSASGMPGFWEVMHDDPVTTAKLMVNLSGDQRERIVYHAIATTVPFSVKNNFNAMARKASHFLPSRLRELYQIGDSHFFAKYPVAGAHLDLPMGGSSKAIPSSPLMIGLFLRNSARYLMYKWKRIVQKRKFILLYREGKLDFSVLDIAKFIPLVPPKRKFWADPFVIERANDRFIFFEEVECNSGKGRIAVIKIDPSGSCDPAQTILERPYHLSYPFIWEINGDYFLMPETSANRTVELYRCLKFPLEWEFSKCLLQDVVLEDPTLFFHEGWWWLFASTRVEKSCTSNDQLVIYFSPDLFRGDWTAHPSNPVITDVSNCRPAGKIFSIGDKIFRPAQNNASRQYGYSIQINEIELLTKTEYKEKLAFCISPDQYSEFTAIHTLNASSSMVVIDAIRGRK